MAYPSPPLFALIIGIDRYKDTDIPRLSGAVADADAMHEFLVSHIRVPEHRVVNLRNDQATKRAMIKSIKGLATEKAIAIGDPILIYYAGHGGQIEPPAQWKPSLGSKIEMLLPYDFASKGSTTQEGQGLFDQTLSVLLDNIAQSKSDNITVILDCCHSGSGTRSTSSIRSIKLPEDYTIPVDVFATERTDVVRHSQVNNGGGSHILLASCTRGQTARESHGRGAFTDALLTLLKREGIDQFTYRGLIRALPDIPLQYPQCIGQNQDRMLFNSRVKIRRQPYSISSDPQNPGKFILDAGSARGVTKGARFSVHSRAPTSCCIGHVECTKAKSFSAECSVAAGTPSFYLPDSGRGFAIQTLAGEGPDICLLIEDKDLRRNIEEEMRGAGTDGRRSFRLVDSTREDPDLIIEYGMSRMPFDIPVDCKRLLSILLSAAHFYRNLRHSNREERNLPISRKKIDVQCLKLVQSREYDDGLEAIFIPKPDSPSLNVDGKILIDVLTDKDAYGFRIVNNLKFPLFAALFYFDVSDLAIVPYYLPGDAAKGMVEVCIPGNGTRPSDLVTVARSHAHFTSEKTKLSTSAQKTPFAPQERAEKEVQRERKETWDAILIPVIQRKGTLSMGNLSLG